MKKIITTLILLLSISAFSQEHIKTAQAKEGSKIYKIDLIKIYEDVLSQGYESEEIYEKLILWYKLEKNTEKTTHYETLLQTYKGKI